MHKWERLELELADRLKPLSGGRHIVKLIPYSGEAYHRGYVDVRNLGLATPFRTCK